MDKPCVSPLLEAKRQVAIQATERLLRTCQFHETPAWLARFVEVYAALQQGKLREAILAECRLREPDVECKYIVSSELKEEVRRVIGSLRNEVHFADGSSPSATSTEPLDVESKGTLAEELAEYRRQLEAMYRRDPIDEDPQYAAILKEAEEITRDLLKDRDRGIFFCHFYWDTKKQILKERFGIAWSTPAELNPHIHFC